MLANTLETEKIDFFFLQLLSGMLLKVPLKKMSLENHLPANSKQIRFKKKERYLIKQDNLI